MPFFTFVPANLLRNKYSSLKHATVFIHVAEFIQQSMISAEISTFSF